MNNHALSEDQILSFKLNGFLLVKSLLSSQEVNLLSDRCDRIEAGEAEHIPQTSIEFESQYSKKTGNEVMPEDATRKLYNIAVHDPMMWQHAVNPKIVDTVSDLLNTNDIKMYGDQLFMKPPRVGSETRWHQDSASWRDIFPMNLVSAWTAIDEATADNGCLDFAPGTHRWGMMRDKQAAWFVGELGTDQWPIISLPMKPGDVSFHHSLVLHHSNANHSGKRRRGYAIHYMRAISRIDEEVTDAPTMPPFRQIRGRSFEGCV